MDSKLRKVIGYFVGIAIIVVLLLKVDIELVRDAISVMNLWFLVPVVFFSLSAISLAGIGLKLLFSKDKKIRTVNMLRYQFIEYIGSIFVPLSGSTLSMIYLLKKKEGISVGVSLSTIILDKGITFFLSIGIAFFALANYLGIEASLNAVYASIAVMIIIYLLFYSARTRKVVIRFLPKKYLEHLSGITTNFRLMIREYKHLIIANAFVTLLKIGAKALNIIFVFKALGFSVGFIDVFLVTTIAQLSVAFPITPGGLGVRQAIGVYLFSLVGVPATITIMMYLVLMIIAYSIGAVSSFVLSHQKHDY